MIRFEKGNKHPLDKKVFWNDIQVKMDDIGIIVNQLCKNEENIYSPLKCKYCRKPVEECNIYHKFTPFKGGQMLIDFLQEVYNTGKVSDKLLRKYKLGEYRP
jgi:hypothetical protein